MTHRTIGEDVSGRSLAGEAFEFYRVDDFRSKALAATATRNLALRKLPLITGQKLKDRCQLERHAKPRDHHAERCRLAGVTRLGFRPHGGAIGGVFSCPGGLCANSSAVQPKLQSGGADHQLEHLLPPAWSPPRSAAPLSISGYQFVYWTFNGCNRTNSVSASIRPTPSSQPRSRQSRNMYWPPRIRMATEFLTGSSCGIPARSPTMPARTRMAMGSRWPRNTCAITARTYRIRSSMAAFRGALRRRSL